jgi:hypothetical protein
MKGKLHKMVSGYILSLNGDIDDPYAIVNEELAKDYEWYKLSLKNCQTIENGYGLVDIKKKIFNGFDGCPDSFTLAAVERTIEVMMELMSDKKFSEEDVKKVVEISRQGSLQENHNGYGVSTGSIFVLDNLSTNDIIQSLKQTEWDVEIVEECLDKNCNGINKKGECVTTGKPKLDSNNCLILKKL